MDTLIAVIVGGLFVAFVVTGYVIRWQDRHVLALPEEPLVVDSGTIGLMAGLLGGTVVDAAVMGYVLTRFEQQYGRPATARDLGLVAGTLQGGR